MLSTLGKIMPKKNCVGLPHSSALIKFPIRPNASPRGTKGAMKSKTDSKDTLYFLAKSIMAITTPKNPPWNDMPPFHNAIISVGS